LLRELCSKCVLTTLVIRDFRSQLDRTTSARRNVFQILPNCRKTQFEGVGNLRDPGKVHLMAVIKPRNRILIFRLTQEEYATLQAASSERGARSLSEFARGQLFGSLETPALGQQLGELSTTVARIAQMLEGN
jgi:hypothetical protein